jgi:hypothetical protein
MRRLLVLVSSLAIVVAACAPSGSGASTTESREPTSTAPQDTATTAGQSTTSQPDTTETTSGRLAAPDFTLELGEGGSYTLSEGTKPVYLVFWAEW